MDIHSEKGVIRGVFGKKAIHLMTGEERNKAMKLKDVWIDIGAKDRKEAEKHVAIGDPITYAVGFEELLNGIVVARGFDNRVGSFCVCETMRILARKRLKVAVYCVSNVQEEIGLRGARTSTFGVDPHVGIALDVGFASDHPNVNVKVVGEVKLGGGPVLHKGANINPVVLKRLRDSAKKGRIPTQFTAEPGATGTDANAIQITRAGVAAALVSIPNRYMHKPVEAVSLKDLDNTAKLLAQFAADLPAKQSFIPR